MSIFQHASYRSAIEKEIRQRKKLGEPLNFSSIAAKAKIQVAYFSNVLKARSHFSGDQIFRIGKALKLAESEADYLLLLMEWERSEDPERKAKLKTQIQKMQNDHLKAEARTHAQVVKEETPELTSYYLDPYSQIVHILLDLEKPKSLEEIAKAIGTNISHLSKIVRNLEKLGYVQTQKNGQLKVSKKGFFLSKDSHLHRPHLALLRLQAVNHMQKLEPEERQAVSICFSADETIFRKVQEEFLVFLSKCETLVKKAPARKAYQLNFDLFPWELS